TRLGGFDGGLRSRVAAVRPDRDMRPARRVVLGPGDRLPASRAARGGGDRDHDRGRRGGDGRVRALLPEEFRQQSRRGLGAGQGRQRSGQSQQEEGLHRVIVAGILAIIARMKPSRLIASLAGAILLAARAGAQETMGAMRMHGLYGSYPMTRDASGTSWQPDSTPHEGLHIMSDGWAVMVHGFADGIYDRQGGPRGAEKGFSQSMLMAVAQHPLCGGTF